MRRRHDDWDTRGEEEDGKRVKRKEGDEIRAIAFEFESVDRPSRDGPVHGSRRKGSEKEKERKEKRRDEKGEDRNWRTRRRRSVVVSRATSYMHLFICNMLVCVRMHDEYIRGVSLALLRLITT